MKPQKKKYPDYDFFLIPDTLVAHEAAKTFSTCRIMMTTTGSSCNNIMYMADKTCIIKLVGPIVDVSNIVVPISIEIYQINIYYPGLLHYKPTITHVNINEALKAIDLAFYVTEHHKWPQIAEFNYFI